MYHQRLPLDQLDGLLKLDGIRWRFWLCDDHCIALWTTEPLYVGGDFLAALVDGEHNVIERLYFPRRMDAKQTARWWFLQRSAYYEYVIQELP